MLFIFLLSNKFHDLLATDPTFENLKSNLIQMIVNRLEEEVVKELVNALYHIAMTRLNPEDVTVSISFAYQKLINMISSIVHSTY